MSGNGDGGGMWDRYESAYKVFAPVLVAFMTVMAEHIREVDPDGDIQGPTADNGDDSGYGLSYERNGVKVFLDLHLRDAGTSAGDADPGEQGNWFLSAVYDGGRVIIGYMPHNYTPECWTAYGDVAELRRRLMDIIAQAPDIACTLIEAVAERD